MISISLKCIAKLKPSQNENNQYDTCVFAIISKPAIMIMIKIANSFVCKVGWSASVKSNWNVLYFDSLHLLGYCSV